ncbi:MAG: hypothetical protein ACYTG0_44030, partial [Planctomycetota bacterium]
MTDVVEIAEELAAILVHGTCLGSERRCTVEELNRGFCTPGRIPQQPRKVMLGDRQEDEQLGHGTLDSPQFVPAERLLAQSALPLRVLQDVKDVQSSVAVVLGQ